MRAATTVVEASALADPALLDESVDGVLFRFVLGARDEISSYLWTKIAQATSRGISVSPGTVAPKNNNVQFIRPTWNVGVLAFLHELCDSGFVMTNVAVQEWTDEKTHRARYAARFVFNRTPLRYPVPADLKSLIELHGMPSLLRLCKEALWQTNAFRNALKEEGHFGIAIGCAACRLLNNSEGKSVVPSKFLRIIYNRVVLD